MKSSFKIFVVLVAIVALAITLFPGVSSAGRKFDPDTNFQQDSSTKTAIVRDQAKNSIWGPNGSEKAPKVPNKSALVIISDAPVMSQTPSEKMGVGREDTRKIRIGDESGVRRLPIPEKCQQFVPNNCCQ